MKSLGKQFSDSLKILRTRIDATMPHYIRCLKPNDGLEPDHFDPKNIVEQLRYCGVLEAVRVSRAGYPTRYPHEVFMTRYYMLCPNRGSDEDNLSPYHNEVPATLTEEQKQLKRLVSRMAMEIWTTEQVTYKRLGGEPEQQDTLHALAQPKSLTEFLQLDFSSRCAVAGLQLGKTKVFLQRDAFDCIESIRNQKFGKNSTIISKSWRRFSAILYRRRASQSVILVQSLIRMRLAAAKTEKLMSEFRALMRMRAAATKLQRCYRSYFIVTYKEGAELRTAKLSVLKIQGCIRGHLARKNITALIYNFTRLQSHVRMIQVRKEYWRKRHAIIKIQSIARVLRALRDVDEAKKQRAALKIQSVARMKSAFRNFRQKVDAASIIKRRYREHLYPIRPMYGTFLKRYYMLGDPKDVKSTSVGQLKKKKILLARHRNAMINSKRHELTKLVNKLALEMWEPGLFESFVISGEWEKRLQTDCPCPAPQTAPAENADSSPSSVQILQFTPIPKSKEEYMNRPAMSRFALVGMQMCRGTVFLRTQTHDCLEKRRNKLVSGSSAKIQALARRKLAVKGLARKRAAAIKLQSFLRMQKERKQLDPMRRAFAATKIQSAFRMASMRKRVWRAYWSTQNRDFFEFIKDDNWYMVERMLHKNPLLVEEADSTTGELPLHKIAERASAWTLLIEMILTLYPKAVVHKDFAGELPIHHAAHAGNLNALEIIFESYKNGARDADGSGRYPIHVAAENGSVEAVKFLTMKMPDCTHAMTSGGSSIPLHLACKNYSSVGVVTSLLRSPLNFSLASRKDDNGELPLHLLLRCGADVDVVAVKSLLTCYLKAIETRDQKGDIPLHIALKHHCKPAVIESLLMHFPSSSIAVDGQGHCPLYLALTHSAADETTMLLINYAPQVSIQIGHAIFIGTFSRLIKIFVDLPSGSRLLPCAIMSQASFQ
jgi:ankyrin repeat protein